MFRLNVTIAIASLLLLFLCGTPAYAQGAQGSSSPGIITPPAVEEGILYFFHWPQTLIAFSETANDIRWSVELDPPLGPCDLTALPAPAPVTSLSAVLVHIGRQLWCVSKVDGHTIWSIGGLPEASRDRALASSDTLPGCFVVAADNTGTLVSLEEESGWWYIRKRMLGDGSVVWEMRVNGEPKGWWIEGNSVWITHKMFVAEGADARIDSPGVISKVNLVNGEASWSTPVIENSAFRATFSASPGRIYLLEETATGTFTVKGFNMEAGDLYRSIEYNAGDFFRVLTSGDKLVFLHREGTEEQKLIKFLLYFSSLNPIRFQSIRESVPSLIFEKPMIDKSLLMYGGATYSLYDGSLVWQELEQVSLVDWAGDDLYLYIWDAAGKISCLDRLYGQEKWSTPFNVLSGNTDALTHYGGASLTLTDSRLFAATPSGELIRIDPVTGEPYPGILRVSQEDGDLSDQNAARQGSSFMRLPWFWLSVVIVLVLGGAFFWVSSKNSSRGDGAGSAGF